MRIKGKRGIFLCVGLLCFACISLSVLSNVETIPLHGHHTPTVACIPSDTTGLGLAFNAMVVLVDARAATLVHKKMCKFFAQNQME